MVKEVLKSEVQLAVRDAMGDPYLQQINEVRLQSQMKDTLTSVLKESNVLLNEEEIRWQMIAGFERYVEGFKDNMNKKNSNTDQGKEGIGNDQASEKPVVPAASSTTTDHEDVIGRVSAPVSALPPAEDTPREGESSRKHLSLIHI